MEEAMNETSAEQTKEKRLDVENDAEQQENSHIQPSNQSCNQQSWT